MRSRARSTPTTSLLLFIAMDRAFRTGRLFLTVGTFLEPPGSVTQQVIATGAGFAFIWGMVISAINLCHATKGCMFALQSAR